MSQSQAFSSIVHHRAHGTTNHSVAVDFSELSRWGRLVRCQGSVWHSEALINAVDDIVILVLGQPRGIGRRVLIDSHLAEGIGAISILGQLQGRDGPRVGADIEVDCGDRGHETTQG